MDKNDPKCIMCRTAFGVLQFLMAFWSQMKNTFREIAKNLLDPEYKLNEMPNFTPPLVRVVDRIKSSKRATHRVTVLKQQCSHLASVSVSGRHSSLSQIPTGETIRRKQALPKTGKSKIPVLMRKMVSVESFYDTQENIHGVPQREVAAAATTSSTLVSTAKRNAPAKKRVSLTVNYRKRKLEKTHKCYACRSVVGTPLALAHKHKNHTAKQPKLVEN